MDNEFPPNNHVVRRGPAQEKPEKKAEKRVQQVTKSKVITRKKPLSRRFMETFSPGNNQGVFEHVVLDVMVPGIKDMIADVVTTSVERTLFGDSYSSRSSRGRGRGTGVGYTSYQKMGGSKPGASRPAPRNRSSATDFSQIIVASRVEAETVIDQMFELISKYEVATVRDLLGLVGQPHTFTDESWGWTDFRGAKTHRVGREGYLLDVPRPEHLD